MERLLRRYYILYQKVWLNAIMDYDDVDDVGPHTPKSSSIELLPKPGCTNLTNLQSDISEKAKKWDWDKGQDKVLRVLTYKYYDCDLVLAHSNENYLHETASAFCLDEEEMETFHLQEFVDFLIAPVEMEIKRVHLPVLQRPEVVTVDESNSCSKAWKWIRNMCTLRSCRQG